MRRASQPERRSSTGRAGWPSPPPPATKEFETAPVPARYSTCCDRRLIGNGAAAAARWATAPYRKDPSSNLPIFRFAAAFTLLEVMLAVTILGLVIGAITATWQAGLSGWRRSASVSDSFQRERVVMGTLEDLTKSIIYAPSKDTLYDINFEHDQQAGDSVSFVTGSDMLLPPAEVMVAGLRRVTVALQRDPRNRPFLGIANAPALQPDEGTPESVWHVLSADVCGFGVRFRNPRDGSWVDKWDEANLIPSAIEYTVAFGANDGRTPPVVVTRAIELPIAAYALQQLGQPLAQGDSTNTVSKQDIPLTSTPTPGDR